MVRNAAAAAACVNAQSERTSGWLVSGRVLAVRAICAPKLHVTLHQPIIFSAFLPKNPSFSFFPRLAGWLAMS